MSANILRVFRLTEHYIIHADGYPFDLLQFADIIGGGTWTRITIEDVSNRWIHDLWQSDEIQELCDFYTLYGMNIEFERELAAVGVTQKPVDTLIITKQ